MKAPRPERTLVQRLRRASQKAQMHDITAGCLETDAAAEIERLQGVLHAIRPLCTLAQDLRSGRLLTEDRAMEIIDQVSVLAGRRGA